MRALEQRSDPPLAGGGVVPGGVVVNDRAVACRPAHARAGEQPGPVLVRVAAPVALSAEDVAAVLFCWDTATYAELGEDDYVRAVVAEAVLNAGCTWLDESRCEAAAVEPGSPGAGFLDYCRRRALSVFTAAPVEGVAR